MTEPFWPTTTHGDAPMIECPYCGEEVQLDDWYEAKTGSEFDCPKCDKAIFCMGTDTITTWSFTTAEDYKRWEQDRERRHQEALARTEAIIEKARGGRP